MNTFLFLRYVLEKIPFCWFLTPFTKITNLPIVFVFVFVYLFRGRSVPSSAWRRRRAWSTSNACSRSGKTSTLHASWDRSRSAWSVMYQLHRTDHDLLVQIMIYGVDWWYVIQIYRCIMRKNQLKDQVNCARFLGQVTICVTCSSRQIVICDNTLQSRNRPEKWEAL